MTIPEERFRAIRWAREYLAAMARQTSAPPAVRGAAEAVLAAFPADARIRELICRNASGLPADTAMPLAAASRWIFASTNDTDPPMLAAVRRHLPRAIEFQAQLARHDLDSAADCPLLGLQHWIAPDIDYVDAVVQGWLGDYAVAVSLPCASTGGEATPTAPWYLIGGSSVGVNHADLQVGQRVMCTVKRPWPGEAPRWMYVLACEVLPATSVDA